MSFGFALLAANLTDIVSNTANFTKEKPAALVMTLIFRSDNRSFLNLL